MLAQPMSQKGARMHRTRTAAGAAFAIALGIGIAAPAIAGETTQAKPVLLTDSEMDRVTAGLNLDLAATAIAAGNNFAVTEANGAGTAGSISLPGGGSVQSGAVVGMAAAYSPGGTASVSTTTSGSAPGTIVYISASGGASFPGGQIEISATFVSGGPTFLP